MSKSSPLILLVMALASGCVKLPEPVCMAPGHVDDGSCTTAILNIIASPESYEGRMVSVRGFVGVVSEGNHQVVLLYPSRDARALEDTTTAIRVRTGGRHLEQIIGLNRVGAPAHATGVFTRAGDGRGTLGEIRVALE